MSFSALPVSVETMHHRWCWQFLASTELEHEITVVRNLHEAYAAAEKRFGEKHIMSYHNQVYITKSAALFVFVQSLEAWPTVIKKENRNK